MSFCSDASHYSEKFSRRQAFDEKRYPLMVEVGEMAKSEKALPYFKQCFVCGETRSGRLGVRFKVINGVVKATFTPTEKHAGFPGIVHSGTIAALLDEAMVWAIYATTGRFALTYEIYIRFLKPLPVGHVVTVIGYLNNKRRKRMLNAVSEIQDNQAVIYARAWGKFLIAPTEESEKWREALQQMKI